MTLMDIVLLAIAFGTAAILLVTAYRDPGLSSRQRLFRWVNALGVCLAVVALLLYARTASEWAANTFLVVLAAWTLTAITLGALHQAEQIRGRRLDATLGVPVAPAPVSTARAFVDWIAWSIGGGIVLIMSAVFAGATMEPGLALAIANIPDAWKLFTGLLFLVIIVAGLGVLIRKLYRDETVRYHRALSEGLTARLQAERNAGYDTGYADAIADRAP